MAMKLFNPECIKDVQYKLNEHRIYNLVADFDSLKVFMNHHSYSVWDFMSLLKAIQNSVAPSSPPWGIRSSKTSRRFINTIVLEEESDVSLPDENGNERYSSHFEMYCEAMKEVGADWETTFAFANRVVNKGFKKALEITPVPAPSKKFISTTMAFIATGKPHIPGAAFAMGREKIVPEMFRELLSRMKVPREEAPTFYYYLERHIHLDEDFHAPLAMQVLNEFCDGDAKSILEAENAAREAILARIEFWDGVARAIEKSKKVTIL